MALTTNQCEMIKAIAENDMSKAKKAAIASCVEDQTQKNRWFTDQYQKILTNSARTIMASIPDSLKWKLSGELPEDFDINRYYLSEKEQRIYEDIYKMNKIAHKLASLQVKYSNSVLLHGPTRTGKTTFGKYVAYQLKLPFFFVNFSQVIDAYLGGTSGNLNKIFAFVKQTPCVFMLDEIDCIAVKRNGKGSKGVDGELERTTVSIMQELDQLPNSVILIGATNRPDILDEAILSRFSMAHEILAFNEEESLAMAQKYVQEEKLVAAGVEFSTEELREIVKKHQVQGLIIKEIIKRIGKQLFEKTDFSSEEEQPDPTGVYRVTYTYEVNVAAENMDDALDKGKQDFQRNYYQAIADIQTI